MGEVVDLVAYRAERTARRGMYAGLALALVVALMIFHARKVQ